MNLKAFVNTGEWNKIETKGDDIIIITLPDVDHSDAICPSIPHFLYVFFDNLG